MRTTIDLPESIYHHSEQIARQEGSSVEQVIVQTLEHAFESEPPMPHKSEPVSFPLITSRHPGTLDLSDFNFDDLFA